MAQTGGKEFYSALQEKATDAVGSTFKAVLYPIQYPAQGDFFWNWQNANQVFNDGTYQYINALVSPGEVSGTAALSAAGGFANGYVQVLNNMIYSLSSSEQQQLDQAQSNATTQAGTVVSDYQNTFGTITEEMMKDAEVTTKYDYVIGYVLGAKWSGKTSPLTYSEMANARNLKALLPKMPASGDQVVTDVTIYLNIMKPVNGLQDKLQNGAWTLSQLKSNTQTPSVANGGMQTFNPNDGSILPGYNVGWGISSSVASIANDLQNKGRTIELGMTTAQASGGQVNVSVQGQAGFSLGSWLQFSTAASGTYDMSKANGTSTDASISIKYEGYSMVPMAPSAWQQATNVGFYYSDPVWQAVANGTSDVSGFKFLGPSPYDMGALAGGGNFGLLTNLLIANYPTITITYSNANFSDFKQSWSEKVTGNLTLFGFIKLGSFSQGAYGSSYSQGSDNSTFTVTFSASPAVVSVPQAMRQAYVIAGSVTNPGVKP